jgi:hypothetical protein
MKRKMSATIILQNPSSFPQAYFIKGCMENVSPTITYPMICKKNSFFKNIN